MCREYRCHANKICHQTDSCPVHCPCTKHKKPQIATRSSTHVNLLPWPQAAGATMTTLIYRGETSCYTLIIIVNIQQLYDCWGQISNSEGLNAMLLWSDQNICTHLGWAGAKDSVTQNLLHVLLRCMGVWECNVMRHDLQQNWVHVWDIECRNSITVPSVSNSTSNLKKQKQIGEVTWVHPCCITWQWFLWWC